MNCPNCGHYNQTGANFCQNCGYRFDEIPQVEPIRVVVHPVEPEQPTIVNPSPATPQQPIVIQQKSRIPTGLIVFLTILLTLTTVGAMGLLGYFLFGRSSTRETAVNTNIPTSSPTPKPSPTPTPDYEQRRDEIAPPDKRITLLDEQFEVAADSHRAAAFTVVESGARVAGGFRVTRGKAVNFAVYTAEDYANYEDDTAGPILSVQARNKVVNDKLKPGNYYAVFENDGDEPLTVAAELFVVSD